MTQNQTKPTEHAFSIKITMLCCTSSSLTSPSLLQKKVMFPGAFITPYMVTFVNGCLLKTAFVLIK